HLSSAVLESTQGDVLPGHQSRIADHYPLSVDQGDSALPWDVLKAFGHSVGDATHIGVLHDRLSQGMLGLALNRRGGAEHVGFRKTLHDELGYLRFTFGEGADLVA